MSGRSARLDPPHKQSCVVDVVPATVPPPTRMQTVVRKLKSGRTQSQREYLRNTDANICVYCIFVYCRCCLARCSGHWPLQCVPRCAACRAPGACSRWPSFGSRAVLSPEATLGITPRRSQRESTHRVCNMHKHKHMHGAWRMAIQFNSSGNHRALFIIHEAIG